MRHRALPGDIPVVPPPRTRPDGVTVEYAANADPCQQCGLPCYVRIDGQPIHSDRCLDQHRRQR